MGKRPTPKKRKPKSRGRTQHSIYMQDEILRLRGRQHSPYGPAAPPKGKAEKKLRDITRVRA